MRFEVDSGLLEIFVLEGRQVEGFGREFIDGLKPEGQGAAKDWQHYFSIRGPDCDGVRGFDRIEGSGCILLASNLLS